MLISIHALSKTICSWVGKRQRNNTTGFIYGVLRADSLETEVGSRDNLPKLRKSGLEQ